MNIVQTHSLSDEQKHAIEAVYAHCLAQEPLTLELFLENEMNIEPLKPCFFLGYKEEKLVSVLTAFFPTKEEVELSGFTHPDYRKNGYMDSLIKHALPLFSNSFYKQALFIKEQGSKSGESFLNKRYPNILRSEYVMELDLRTWKPQSADGQLLEVTKETQQETAGILSEIFEQDEQTSNQHLDFLLSRPDRQVFLYQKEGVLVGTANVHYISKTVAMIHALGIHPSYRRRGYGKAMLTNLLTLLADKVYSARLEVDSDNPPALALYRSMGFCTLNRVDYHAMIF